MIPSTPPNLDYDATLLADLADGTLAGPDWEAWLAARPDAARQVEISRRVRDMILQLQAAEVAIPVGFEARLMERVRQDTTFLDLLDFWFLGVGNTLLELLDLVFGAVPEPRSVPSAG